LKDRLKRIEIFGDLGVHPSEEATLRYKKGKGRVESPGYESDEVSTRLLDGDETKCIIFDVSAMSSVDARYLLFFGFYFNFLIVHHKLY
jgi:hypothetical protein